MRAIGMWGAAVVALIAAGAARADVKAGVDAWQAGDFGRAVAEWQPLADKGDPDAEFNLGQAYKLGQGVPKNMTTAQELFTKAANQGHEQAQATLGLILFQNGDRVSAMPWIRKAAQAGEPRAQYIYGTALYNGDVVGRDLPLAYAMMSRAAAAGLPQATNSLAVMNERMPAEDKAKGQQMASALPTAAGQTVVAQNNAGGVAGTPDRGAPRVLPSTFSLPASNGAAVQAPPQPAPAAPAPAPRPKPVELAAAEPKAPPAKLAPAKAPSATKPATKPSEPKPSPSTRTETAAKAPARSAAPAKTAAAAPRPAQTSGAWRIQLGAFSTPANARDAWKEVSGNSAVAGRGPSYVAAGKMTRLQVGSFASASAAAQACAALKRGSGSCMPVKP